MIANQQNNTPINGKKFVNSGIVFNISIIVSILTILSIWLFGLGQNRTFFENSLLSTSILSTAFFLFLTIGLYSGIKLKDTIGDISSKINTTDFPDISSGLEIPSDIPDIDEGFVGVIFAVLAWILFSVVLLILIWFFGAFFWTMILFFVAMLYWIFFRALRLVFKNSNKCKGNFFKSASFGFAYTLLYNSWIYIIILASHYLV